MEMIAREKHANAKTFFNTRMLVTRAGCREMLFSFGAKVE